MEILELKTNDTHRNVEWPTTLEDFLDRARSKGHQVSMLHGSDQWLVVNPISMAWCEVGRSKDLPG